MEGSRTTRNFLKKYLSTGVGVILAVTYGLFTRLQFGSKTEILNSLSISFFLITPAVLGFLTILPAPADKKSSWGYTIFFPWLSCTVCTVIAGIFALEAWFCIILSFPIFLLLASVGGIIARFVWRSSQKSKGVLGSVIVVFTLAPYLFAPFEPGLPLRTEIRQVHSVIEIDASPELVWQNITNLPPIRGTERQFATFHVVGLPRPVEARMTCEEIGCLRRGRWEYGLAFDGTIMRIEPGKLYYVSLKADTSQVLPSMAPLSQIGGPVFNMVDDGYEIEALPGGRTRLHLYSTYRLTTRINFYASLWLDFLMGDIQRHILQIEKVRSEKNG